jgi:RimJ/RimL family protein N-acetyltransferase
MQLPELTTERLWLRPWQESDLPALLAMDGDADVRRYVSDGKVPDPTAHEKRLRERICTNGDEGLGFWSVFRREQRNDLLGIVGLVRLSIYPGIELDYRYRTGAWGQGFATEAAAACLDYAFRTLGLREIVALVYPENLASQRVIAKLGFAPVGRLRADAADLLFYRIGDGPLVGAAES